MYGWKLSYPKKLTEEENTLQNKYQTLRNCKLKLDFHKNHKNTNLHNFLDGSTEACQFLLKKAAGKVLESSGEILRKESSKEKKTSGFKRPTKQNEECQAVQKKYVMKELGPDTGIHPRSVTVRGTNLKHQLVLETFRKFGDIIKIGLSRDNDSAIVTYRNPEHARTASAAKHITSPKESTEFSVELVKPRNFSWVDISVKEAVECDASSIREMKTVHVSYQGVLTRHDLRYVFRSVGRIEKIYISSSCASPPKKQFAFVTFQLESEAERAVDEVNGHVYNGVTLTVSLHRKSTRRDYSSSTTDTIRAVAARGRKR